VAASRKDEPKKSWEEVKASLKKKGKLWSMKLLLLTVHKKI
jgi:hypothetical protein